MDTVIQSSSMPPRAPLVIRVGVTGHRPDSKKRASPDIPATRKVIADILTIIKTTVDGVADVSGDLFAACSNDDMSRTDRRLRVISPLAAGADQWVADEALKQGFELHSPLPFIREVYRQDFTHPADAAEYERLLRCAKATLELDGRVESVHGERRPDPRSYEALGRVILDQSDLLIAIWDGRPAQGTGGTASIVQEALRRGTPVIWIPWGHPTGWSLRVPVWRLVETKHDLNGGDAHLIQIVRELLLPPSRTGRRGEPEDLRSEYFKERPKRGRPLHGVWTLFRMAVCGEFLGRGAARAWTDLLSLTWYRVRDFEQSGREQLDNEWREKESPVGGPFEHPVPEAVRSWVDTGYLQHYAWANGLSIYYGNLYRGAFVLNYLLGALAVFLALVSFGSIGEGIGRAWESLWILGEFAVIVGILALTRNGRRKKWHQRWIDYRTLAERLRLARFLSLLGGGGPQVAHAGHLSTYGNPLHTWMHWHYRAVERAAGMPNTRFNREYLEACREFCRESLVEAQRSYHQSTADRFAKLDKRLHRTGDALFAATLIACILHLAASWADSNPAGAWIPHGFSSWLTVLAACLPALGAALAAIRSQAETQRLTQRSIAMKEALESAQLDLATIHIREDSLDSQQLRECLDRVSDLMIREMLDWRVVFQDRPLALPA